MRKLITQDKQALKNRLETGLKNIAKEQKAAERLKRALDAGDGVQLPAQEKTLLEPDFELISR